jgi:hypothetical protein
MPILPCNFRPEAVKHLWAFSSRSGVDLHAFTGLRAAYDSAHVADWQSAEALAVSTYSSLFNTNPFFSDPPLIILDDAHSGTTSKRPFPVSL